MTNGGVTSFRRASTQRRCSPVGFFQTQPRRAIHTANPAKTTELLATICRTACIAGFRLGFPSQHPSPTYGRRFGGKGRGSQSAKYRDFLAHCPHPNPLPEGEGTYITVSRRERGLILVPSTARGRQLACAVRHAHFGKDPSSAGAWSPAAPVRRRKAGRPRLAAGSAKTARGSPRDENDGPAPPVPSHAPLGFQSFQQFLHGGHFGSVTSS